MTLSLEETMTRLHCKRRKVFDLLKDGRLVRAQRLGKELRITESSVIALEFEIERPQPKARSKVRRPPLTGVAARIHAVPLDGGPPDA